MATNVGVRDGKRFVIDRRFAGMQGDHISQVACLATCHGIHGYAAAQRPPAKKIASPISASVEEYGAA